jgi:soluble lytic murein transglycosylase-like protein
MRIGSGQPLGPEGIRQRVEQIENKMEAALGERFDAAMEKASGVGSGLRGEISGRLSSIAPNFSPFNPFADGASLNSRIAPEQIKRLIDQAASEAGVDAKLLDALVRAESNYDPTARSRAGALGLTQLMPGTASELGVSNPLDPAQNLRGGARYLSQMLSRFGDVRLALAAYNAGPGAVERAGGIPNYPETQAYVRKVMSFYGQP